MKTSTIIFNKKMNFICDFCGQEEKGKGYLSRHIDRKHRKFSCNVCDQIYSQKANLFDHLKSHFERFVCQFCGIEIHHMEKFLKHVYRKHEPNNKSLILSVQSQESYKCRFCVRSFPSAVHRNVHESLIHKKRTEAAFKCKECQLICITKDQLRTHSFEHYAGTLHFCAFPGCDRFFREVRQLTNHEKIHGQAKYECQQCGKKFTQSSNYCKHKKRCKGKSKIELKEISKEEQEMNARTAKEQFLALGGKIKMDEKEILIKKRRKKTAEKVLEVESSSATEKPLTNQKKRRKREELSGSGVIQIEISGDKITENSIKVEKISKNEGKPKKSSKNPKDFTLICDSCGFQTISNSDLRVHLKNHLQEKILTCSDCNLSFTKKTDHNKHLRLTHNISSRKKRRRTEFICDFCGLKITKLSYLSRHMKKHIAMTDECKICNVKLRNLPKHMKIAHSTERPFICSTCGSGFKARNNLNNHLRTHEEPRECPICHKLLPNLSRHLKWHQKPKSKVFNCPQCNKVCATKQTVEEHIRRVHEKAPLGKIYSCQVCELEFIRNSDLRRHSYIHYTGKIYACTYPGCTEMFKKSFKLSCHLQVHTPTGITFQCEFCDRKYLRKPTLKKHKMQSHPENSIK